MKDVNSSREPRYIRNTEGAAFIPNANLADARADVVHRLPVIRLQPMLHPVKLVPGSAPGHLWKPAKHIERIAKKLNSPVGMHSYFFIQIFVWNVNRHKRAMGPLSGGPALEAWMGYQIN